MIVPLPVRLPEEPTEMPAVMASNTPPFRESVPATVVTALVLKVAACEPTARLLAKAETPLPVLVSKGPERVTGPV